MTGSTIASADRHGPSRPMVAWPIVSHERAVFVVIFATMTFNYFLCIANTVAFRVSDVIVMLSEVFLIGCATMLTLDRRPAFPLILTVYVAYMAFILALRPQMDLKAIRDFLIPITFYFLGRRDGDVRGVDAVMFWSGVVVLVVGLLEYFFLEPYTSVVNILQYYIARGTLAAVPEFMQGGPQLFASGQRFTDRNLLGWLLSAHRVSSIFLEPVSAGNYGGILYIWALVRPDMRRRWLTLALGISAIVLSDARFGFYVCVVLTPLAVLATRLPRLLWMMAPLLAMMVIGFVGHAAVGASWDDDFTGRIRLAGLLMRNLDAAAVFGISGADLSVADSGYAYTLTHVGLVGFAALWGLLLYAPSANRDGWRFKAQAMGFTVLCLIVSNSIFSIKIAALLWWAVGAMDGAGRTPAAERAGDTAADTSAEREERTAPV